MQTLIFLAVCLLLLIPYFVIACLLLLFGKQTRKRPLDVQSNSKPSVSVLLPTYNEETFVRKKLDNLLGQDYPLTEILIYDCSTDSTQDIVSDYQKRFPIIKLIKQGQRIGNARTLNQALQDAKGEIVIKTDCDSYCLSDRGISNLVENFGNTTIGGVTGICKGISGVEPLFRRFMTRMQVAESNLDSTVMGHSTSLLGFRKIATSPVNPQSMAEDTEELILIRKKDYRNIVDTNVVSVEDVSPDDNIRRRQKSRRAEGILDAIVRNRDMFSPRYGKYGTVVLPMEFFMLALSPIFLAIIAVILAVALYSVSPFATLGFCLLIIIILLPRKSPARAIAETQAEALSATFKLVLGRGKTPTWVKAR